MARFKIVAGRLEQASIEPMLQKPATREQLKTAIRVVMAGVAHFLDHEIHGGAAWLPGGGKYTFGCPQLLDDGDDLGFFGDYPAANMAVLARHSDGGPAFEGGNYREGAQFLFVHVRWEDIPPKHATLQIDEEWYRCMRQLMAAMLQQVLRQMGL